MPSTSIDYVVKAFQHSVDLPRNGCADIDVSPFAQNPFAALNRKLEQRDIPPHQYLDQLLGMLCKRIDAIETDPAVAYVMIDIFRGDSARSTYLRALRQYAKQVFGERFFSFTDGTTAASRLGGLVANGLVVRAYGEFSDRCVIGETKEFARELLRDRPTLRIRYRLDRKLCDDTVVGKFAQVPDTGR